MSLLDYSISCTRQKLHHPVTMECAQTECRLLEPSKTPEAMAIVCATLL